MALPKSTVYNRRIPKQKFYDNLRLTPGLKRVFVEQVNAIYWRNKIAPGTVNVAKGELVKEIEVIEIQLNQPSLDKRAIQLIDKEIPYHILFLLTCKGQVQAWINYKERGKPGAYYSSEWLDKDRLSLSLEGLNLDLVYEGFIRAIAGERLPEGTDLIEAITTDERRQQLRKEIAVLENKIRRETQFNIQVELNNELKKSRMELGALTTEKKQGIIIPDGRFLDG